MLISSCTNGRRTGLSALLRGRNKRQARSGCTGSSTPAIQSIEKLEDRTLLSAVVTAASAGAFSGLATFLDAFVDIDSILPSEAQQRLRSDEFGIGNSLTYQAYTGEANEVSISQQIGDFLYIVNEGNGDIPAIPVPLAFHSDVLNDLSIGFSFVIEVTVDVADIINIPDATAIVPNGKSLLEFIPGIGGPDGVLTEMVNILGDGLDFGLGEIISFVGDATDFVQDAIDTAIGPITSAIGDIAHSICKAVDKIPGVNPNCKSIANFTESLIGDLADNLNPLPNVPTGLLEFGRGIINGLTNTFTTESVYVDTLDGDDTIDLTTLNSVGQLVYAGADNDTITAGGGSEPIRLFGQAGIDTFIINFLFDAEDYNVDGGIGNDIIQVPGTETNDIFRLVGNNGQLTQIVLEAPNPNAGVTANEVQTITLPNNVTGGDFTLSFDGETTAPILSTADGSAVETALELLTGLNAADIAVAGGGRRPVYCHVWRNVPQY